MTSEATAQYYEQLGYSLAVDNIEYLKRELKKKDIEVEIYRRHLSVNQLVAADVAILKRFKGV